MSSLKIHVNLFVFLLISLLIAGCLNNNSNDSQLPEDDRDSGENDNENPPPDDDTTDPDLPEDLDEEEPDVNDDESDDPDELETIIKPEDVNLSVDRPQDVRTMGTNWYEIIGEPTGSNITWLVDSEIVGYENKILYEFPRSDYFLLEVIVKWDNFEKVFSEIIPVKNHDDIGGFSVNDREILISSDDPIGYGIWIKPGISVPTLWINISIKNGNGKLNYWMDLQRENELEAFERVSDETVELNFDDYAKTFYFDESFFIERSNNEPYIFWFIEELADDKGSFASIETLNELRY